MQAISGRPALVLLFCFSATGPVLGEEPAWDRYRVEQTFRLQVTTAQPLSVPGRLRLEPVSASVESRLTFHLERESAPTPSDGPEGTEGTEGTEGRPGVRRWRFTRVGVEGPAAETESPMAEGMKRALGLALARMQDLEGKEYTGDVAELPVFPLGEQAPAWLTQWLRFAQTGLFSGTEGSPVQFPGAEVHYQVRWLRSDFRREPCTVQQATWTAAVEAAPGSISPELAAEGVEARTRFSASSLEWVTQTNPQLVYAERSAVRETFWDLSQVQKPELQGLTFRLHLAVQVRVERLP